MPDRDAIGDFDRDGEKDAENGVGGSETRAVSVTTCVPEMVGERESSGDAVLLAVAQIDAERDGECVVDTDRDSRVLALEVGEARGDRLVDALPELERVLDTLPV